MSDRYSHPMQRKNPRQHGTLSRYDAGCTCWRCLNAALKDAKARVQQAEAVGGSAHGRTA